jgi:hypothetical protein
MPSTPGDGLDKSAAENSADGEEEEENGEAAEKRPAKGDCG